MGLMWKSDERPISNRDATWIRTMRMANKLSRDKEDLYDKQILGMMKDSVVEQSHPEGVETQKDPAERNPLSQGPQQTVPASRAYRRRVAGC